MAVGNHARKELLGEVVVAESVDLEGQVDVLFGRLEDGLAACDTCIVDENRGVSQCGADRRSGVGDGVGGAEVAFEEADRRRCWWV